MGKEKDSTQSSVIYTIQNPSLRVEVFIQKRIGKAYHRYSALRNTVNALVTLVRRGTLRQSTEKQK